MTTRLQATGYGRPTQSLAKEEAGDTVLQPKRSRSGPIRAAGHLKLSIGAFSSRYIDTQHKSMRHFLRGESSPLNHDLDHPNLAPDAPISPVFNLRQTLTTKCEACRGQKKSEVPMSFRWGSLEFELKEDEELCASQRASEAIGDAPKLSDYERHSTLNFVQEGEEEEEEEEEEAAAASETPTTPTTGATIEVAPGIHMPLKTPLETWLAVEEGRVTVTTCNRCKVELTCTDDACVVMCADCWVFSPVDQALSSPSWAATDVVDLKNGCVSVGIQTEEIFEWLVIQEAADMLG
jgi:hypothetical protein